MAESILSSVKKYIGFEDEYEVFDKDLLMHINSSLNTLTQLGMKPDTGIQVEDKNSTWDDLNLPLTARGFVEDYVYTKAKIAFDPPQSSFLLDALKERIKELEFRINVEVDTDILGS